MIDWLTARLVLPHRRIEGEKSLRIAPDGEMRWISDLGIRVPSHDQHIRVRSVDTKIGPSIELSGCPLKFLQGHNLFGSSNIMGLLGGMYEKVRIIATDLQLPVIEQHSQLDVDIRVVDITEMFDLGSNTDVDTWLHHQAIYASSRRGTAQFDKGTIYFTNKNSRYWGLKAYNKKKEITARGHTLSKQLN